MKQKLLLILILCLTTNFIYGQDFNSLKAKAKNTVNSEKRLNIYLTLIDTLIWNEAQLDECKTYIQEARELASAYGTENDKLHIELLAMRRDFYTSTGDVVKWMNENEATYLRLKSPLLKAKYFLFAGIVRENKSLYGLPYFTEARKIYEKEKTKGNYDKYLLDTYHRLTVYYRYSNRIDSSLHYLNAGFELNEVLKDPTSSIWFALEQLEHYKSQARYSEGIQLCLKWINGKKGNLSFSNEITFREKLMIFYLDNLELDRVIEIGHQLIEDIKQQGISNRTHRKIVAYAYLRMGIVDIKQHKYQTALELLDKALLYEDDLSRTLLNIEVKVLKLQAYLGLKEYERVKKILEEYISTLDFLDGGSSIPDLLVSIYLQFYAETNFKPSSKEEHRLQKGIQHVLDNSQNKDYEIILNAYRLRTLLSIIKSGNKSLKEDFLNTLKINEKLNNTRNAQTTKNLLIQYQTKEKEQELELQKLELARKNTQRNILIGVFFIFLLIGCAILFYFRNRNQHLQQDLQNKERIAKQAEELERLYEQQNRLFNNIAHELRTPLTLIHAPVNSVIKKTKQIPEIQQDLSTAKRNINYLQQMINQILDLSKIQNKQFTTHSSTFQLNDLFNALYDDFEPLAKYKEIDFQFILPDVDVKINTDGNRLFTVLKNLLSNAFKYTPSKGKINIIMIDLGTELQITVEDNGQGIPKADLPKVFDYYFQTEDKNKLLEGGTGIGLAICKEYIKAMNGTITVNSELGRGTSFIITIPQTRADKQPELLASHAPSFLKNQNNEPEIFFEKNNDVNTSTLPHILVVEDNIEIANYLATVLEKDYHLTFKGNGKEALTALENIQPDLILTDLMMPVMNGYELIESLKTNEKWQKTPIITLTALGETAHKIKALRIGVDDYLVKPFDEEELQLRIQNLLQNKFQREEFEEEVVNNPDNEVGEQPVSEPQHSSTDLEWLELLETTVKNRMSDVNFNVTQLRLELNTNSAQLYRKTKRLVGISPKEYLNQVRYTAARKMLENQTYDSVKRVAYEVGFKDEKNFARNFKKRFGKYPSEYWI